MTSLYRLSASLWLPMAVVMAAGCSDQSAPPPAEGVVEEEVVEEVEVPALSTDAESDEVTAAMAELSVADRTAALAQKICPVSDEPLGSMGTPIKVTIGDRTVFICCESCREKLEAEPDKYLAKLDAKPAN